MGGICQDRGYIDQPYTIYIEYVGVLHRPRSKSFLCTRFKRIIYMKSESQFVSNLILESLQVAK